MLVQTTRDDHRIAWLTALATTFHLLESALPNPFFGVKLGLANIITVVVLLRFGWKLAAWVNLLRVLASGLLLGTFLSPTFILSLSGALASTAVLGVFSAIFGHTCSALGYSVASALSHITAQFYVAYWLWIRHDGLLQLLPIFLTFALIFGIISGMIANLILSKLPTDS